MPLLDISGETAVQIDGQSLPLSLLRALLFSGSGYVHIEADDGSVEGVDIRREGEAVHFVRNGRSGRGAEGRPVQMLFRAELRGPKGAREWVSRGSSRHSELAAAGWTESGITRAGNVARAEVEP